MASRIALPSRSLAEDTAPLTDERTAEEVTFTRGVPAIFRPMLKGIQTLDDHVVDRRLQPFGGYGSLVDYPIAVILTGARVRKIHGGANEVLKTLVARAL